MICCGAQALSCWIVSHREHFWKQSDVQGHSLEGLVTTSGGVQCAGGSRRNPTCEDSLQHLSLVPPSQPGERKQMWSCAKS